MSVQNFNQKPTMTLDINCVVDLEKTRENAPFVKKLVAYYLQGTIDIAVVAISASEKQQDGSYPITFEEFRRRLDDVGLSEATILPALAYWNICFFDQAVWGSTESEELERQIHGILFPTKNFKFGTDAGTASRNNPLYQKWRNRKCDVLALWSHIKYKRDVFVSNDGNFFKKSKMSKLIALGAGAIARPSDAVRLLETV